MKKYIKAITGVVTHSGKEITSRNKFYEVLILNDENRNETDVTIIGGNGGVHKISKYYTDEVVYEESYVCDDNKYMPIVK